MSSDLQVTLIVAAWSAVIAFTFYWRGYRAHQLESAQLEADLDAAIEALTRVSARNGGTSLVDTRLRLIQGGAS